MKITVLAYLEADATEPDVVVPQVAEVLRGAGHDVSSVTVRDDVRQLVHDLRGQQPDLVFNLLESFGDDIVGGQMGVCGLLDLLQLPYTGGGPGELYLQEDKALAKKLLSYEGVLYPDFASFAANADFETGGKLRMPLFVKPARSDASIGIDAEKSLVRNTQELLQQVSDLHQKFGGAVLAEEYIEGRELYIGVLGNQEPLVFPPVEMDFSDLPDGMAKVMDNKAKFDTSSEQYHGTKAVIPELPAELKAKLQKVALAAYRALRVRDYGRIDLRLTESGEIYVIEANANCYLERNSEYAMAAAAAEIDYPTLIERITQAALQRQSKAEVRSQKSEVPSDF